ncbi:MAG: protein translocase subunit SecF [Alphaproteobacteria bacterium]|nr:protein translocase subunit SecF [Alphaproteobacteria bacterium]
MFLKLVPDNTKIAFIKMRIPAMIFSGVLIIGSIVAMFTHGLNFGIDFRGGVTIEVADEEPIDVGAVREAVSNLGLGNVKVQEIRDFAGGDEAVVVFVERQDVDVIDDGASDGDAIDADTGDGDEAEDGKAEENAQQAAAALVQDALRTLLGDNIEFRKIDVVGPAVSGELIQKGAIAIVLAIAMMLIYIWFRFEWQFSLGAIAALVHDVAITLGLFAVTSLEFNLSIIAAILTIVGYSMNDTVVVYDRVRENLRKYKSKPLDALLDLSINETLSRTVMTSITTLLALGALVIFGGEVLRGFTLAMIWGIVIGTYSSIFVASPFLLATGVKRDWSKVAATAAP